MEDKKVEQSFERCWDCFDMGFQWIQDLFGAEDPSVFCEHPKKHGKAIPLGEGFGQTAPQWCPLIRKE